jgi:uncharacterized Tic20 family protein
MHSYILASGGQILAAGTDGLTANAPSWLKTAAVFGILIFAATLLTVLIGLKMLKDSKKVDVPEQAKTALNVMIAYAVIAAGIGGMFLTVATGTIAYFVAQS